MDISSFEGIVEMDDTYFLYSEKGQRKIKDRKPPKRGGSAKKRGISNEQVCVLVARDRDKLTFSQTLGMGRLTKEQLDKAIGHKLSSENVLCTDSWRAFKTYATEKGMNIYQFKSDGKVRTKGLYHIQSKVPNHLRNRQLEVIWIKNNQEIFSFNPDIYKSNHNKIKDEIIEVMTENNSLVGERDTILGGGANDPLKIKLMKRDVGLTYKTLEPELKRLGLDDNLRYLVTVDQYILKDIYNMQQTIKMLFMVTSGLIVGILFLVTQNIIVYFNKNQQKIVVHRLFGISFFRTYRGYMW
ncbi:hypothetical protein AZF08_25750 [Bacillus gaemokensis]|nr:hypothetical protein AZF08_25750 [Bacillus gaemokensis]